MIGAVLVTGASGFLGQAVVPRLLEKGCTVHALSRHPLSNSDGVVPLAGDITKPNLGLASCPDGIEAVLHMAALLDLTERHRDRVWEVNVTGTQNVLEFCSRHRVHRLFFVSTAYTKGRNTYERSKARAESMVMQSGLHTTILKPSILIGDSQMHGLPPPGNFYTVTSAVDRVKRWVETTAGLPQLKLTIRLPGNPEGELNLIPVDRAAEGIVEAVVQDKACLLYTSPSPRD